MIGVLIVVRALGIEQTYLPAPTLVASGVTCKRAWKTTGNSFPVSYVVNADATREPGIRPIRRSNTNETANTSIRVYGPLWTL